MKKQFLLIFIAITPFLQGRAQEIQASKAHALVNTIGVSFQKIDIGHGLQLDYGRLLPKGWELRAGLYIHFNALPRDDQNYAYHNRGWADSWDEHLGLNLAVEKNLVTYESTSVFTFYSVRMTRTSFRDKQYMLTYLPDSTIGYAYTDGYIYGPIFGLENTIGIGVKTMFSPRFGFRIRGGLGISLYYDPYSISGITPILWTYNWSGMNILSAGVFYRF